MLARIKHFFESLTGEEAPASLGEDEIRLAVAALLYHVIAIDGVVSEAERTTLTDVLKQEFDLDPAETRELVAAAQEADAEAVDLYGFTSVLKRRMEVGDRERVIRMMWQMVYADGGVHEFEDNIVWRVAELLAVPTQVRIGLKQSVRSESDEEEERE